MKIIRKKYFKHPGFLIIIKKFHCESFYFPIYFNRDQRVYIFSVCTPFFGSTKKCVINGRNAVHSFQSMIYPRLTTPNFCS